MNPTNTLGGLRIIEDPNLTEAGDPVQVVRTWRERLLTRPWRPWQRTKTVVPQVPSRQAFRIGRGTVVMHPAMVQQLKAELERARWN